MALILVIFCFPSNPGPNAMDMNYSALLLGGYFLITLGSYYFPVYGGRYWFRGPVSNLASSEMSGSDSGSEKDSSSAEARVI